MMPWAIPPMLREKKTVVLIAYKVLAHTLDRSPEIFLGN